MTDDDSCANTPAKANSMTSAAPTIMWFRHDLRLADNRALTAAAQASGPVIPVYILDDVRQGAWAFGGASRWWLHQSLTSLAAGLAACGSRLILRRGDPRKVLAKFIDETGATTVVATRGYEPWAAALEADVKAMAAASGAVFRRFGGTLLFEPEQLRTKMGDPFRVYTPMWRCALAGDPPKQPTPAPDTLKAPKLWPRSDILAAWDLLPTKPDWSGGMGLEWTPGEDGARARLDQFLKTSLGTYDEERNRPDRPGTSKLSPHLRFGEISPNMCWYAARAHGSTLKGGEKGLETFLKELVWREFAYHLLAHWPTLPETSFKADFERFPWLENAAGLKAWQKGLTGYPIVDAGMRELWHTGWMHNRVRMITGSFLVKDLMLPWQSGEAWFWDTLVDADLASNSASWQWVAGTGADAAPYFRVFNPVKQGETYDPDGAYVRQWIPEIARLPTKLIHAPWTAPKEILAACGVVLGKTYPHPIVDHAMARDRALAAFKSLRAAE
jgi:deoxyribodipyrimidine photo-lyase